MKTLLIVFVPDAKFAKLENLYFEGAILGLIRGKGIKASGPALKISQKFGRI